VRKKRNEGCLSIRSYFVHFLLELGNGGFVGWREGGREGGRGENQGLFPLLLSLSASSCVFPLAPLLLTPPSLPPSLLCFPFAPPNFQRKERYLSPPDMRGGGREGGREGRREGGLAYRD